MAMCCLMLHAGPVSIETRNISLILNADEGEAPEYAFMFKCLL